METVTQFSVFMVNKPGVLAKIIAAVAGARINLVAMTIVDAQEHGVLRLVGGDAERLRGVLVALNLPMHENEVLTVELPNRSGALATVLGTLATAHVNIEYAYATAGGRGGKTTAFLKVDQLPKAQKLLRPKPERRESKPSTVRSRAGRRR